MVVGAFPVAKLGALLLRQISKPIANAIKEEAKASEFFRTYICMPPAQFYNWCEVKSKMWIMNLGKPVQIPTLNEPMAIELGANLLGEGIIFSIAATLIFFEYNRQSRKEAVKEILRKKEIVNLHDVINELALDVEKQHSQISEISRLVADLEARVIKLPTWTQLPGKCVSAEPNSAEENQPESTTDLKLIQETLIVGPYVLPNPEIMLTISFEAYLDEILAKNVPPQGTEGNNDTFVRRAISFLRKKL